MVDATSGDSGSGMRDRKMNKEVLESARYPEIDFRPDRFDGEVAPQGKSSVMVHGMFSIHGTDHEITVPAEVEMYGRSLDCDRALHRSLREVGDEESQHVVSESQRFGGN